MLEAFWRDFKPKTAEVMEQKPSEITAALDEFLAPWLFPDKDDGTRSAALPGLRRRAGWRCAAASSARSSPAPTIPSASSPAASARAARRRRGCRPAGARRRIRRPAQDVTLRTGRFGPYFQLGEGKEAKRASIPKDVPAPTPTSRSALRLLSLPRTVGDASRDAASRSPRRIGRYGPYLAHDGKYAKLGSTAEVFETGMNAAVAKLADAANGRRPRRAARASR